MANKVRVVAIGQVPPPVTGQAVMIRMLVDAAYERISITHVPLALSNEVADMGNFGLQKIVRLVQIPVKAIYQRFRTGATVLYYPPSGPVKLAVYRDIFVLLLTRPFFRRTVLHFHAGGLSTIYPSLSPLVQRLYRKALFHADVILRISPSSPSELGPLHGKREVLVPNGIPDPCPNGVHRLREPNAPVQILFIGHLVEGKGILILLEAFALLLQRGLAVRLTAIGHWGSESLRAQAEALVAEHGMEGSVTFPGGLTGEPKWACYREADVFCFPSHFHSEVFPLVLLEAMACSLPIVTTRWRGIPDVVAEDSNALLVPTQDPAGCSEALARLVADRALREQFGRASRERFLAHFRAEVHLAAMEQAILVAAQS